MVIDLLTSTADSIVSAADVHNCSAGISMKLIDT